MPELEPHSPETTPPPEEASSSEYSDSNAKMEPETSEPDSHSEPEASSDDDANPTESLDPLVELETQLESTVATLTSLLTQLDDLDPVPESEDVPDASSNDDAIPSFITAAKHARDTAQARLDLLRIQRETQTVQTKLHAVQETWDESVDGPMPISPDPLPLDGDEDTRTETERLLEEYAETTTSMGGTGGRTNRDDFPMRRCRMLHEFKNTKKTQKNTRSIPDQGFERGSRKTKPNKKTTT